MVMSRYVAQHLKCAKTLSASTRNGPVVDKTSLCPLLYPRPDLHEYLLSRIPPGKLTTGKRVIDISETQSDVTVTCMDETTYVGHMVVGADGAYSATRQIMYQKLRERGLLPESDTIPLHFDKQCVVGKCQVPPAVCPTVVQGYWLLSSC